MRMLLLLVVLCILSACASAPRSAAVDQFQFEQPMDVVKQARHVQFAVAVNRPALQAARSIELPRVRLTEDAAQRGITPQQQALLANAVARAACTELAKRFELRAPGEMADLQLDLVLTAVRRSSAAASGLSALVGVVVPGPSRLPLGLGGLAGQAQVSDADGKAVLSARWARGARSVAEDASMSRIGDAWQLARMLGRDVARELSALREPKAQRRSTLSADSRRAGRALCAQHFGTTPILGRGLGKLLPLSPESMDSGAPADQATEWDKDSSRPED